MDGTWSKTAKITYALRGKLRRVFRVPISNNYVQLSRFHHICIISIYILCPLSLREHFDVTQVSRYTSFFAAHGRAELRHEKSLAQHRSWHETGYSRVVIVMQQEGGSRTNCRKIHCNVYIQTYSTFTKYFVSDIWGQLLPAATAFRQLHVLRAGAQQSVRGGDRRRQRLGLGAQLRALLLLHEGHWYVTMHLQWKVPP